MKELKITLFGISSFFMLLLTLYIGSTLGDAFTGGENFFRDWLIILFICLPFYLLGSWTLYKNKGGL